MASKGYTLAYYIREVQGCGTTGGTNGLVNGLAPIGLTKSVKFQTLNTFLGGNFNAIAGGTGKFVGLAKTPRGRVLKALRFRKKNGFNI